VSRTRRGFLRAIGVAVVASPVAIPAALTKAAAPAQRAAETVQRARLGMIVLKDRPIVRIGEQIVVKSDSGPFVPRVAGVVERVDLRAAIGEITRADVVIRVLEGVGRGARDVTNATQRLETWTETLLEAAAR